MSKQLIFIRHGDYDMGHDHLNKTGKGQVAQSSGLLKDFLINKNYVLIHSPEIRAQESAEIINTITGNNHALHLNRGLIFDNPVLLEDFVYEELRKLDDTLDTVILITHQPLLDAQRMAYGWHNFPIKTGHAGGYVIEVDSWNDVEAHSLSKNSRPVAYFTPKKLTFV